MPARTSPDAELLRLGAGELFIDVFDALGVATGAMRHLGNVETLEITTTDDPLIKKSSMTAGRPVYKKVTRSREVVLRVVGDEFSVENMALMMMGDIAYVTIAAVAITDHLLYLNVPTATLGAALGGRFFFAGQVNIGTIVVKLGAATLVLGTDYIVYSAHYGIIQILATSTATTNGTDDLTITSTPQAITGLNSPVVRGGTLSEINAAFLFLEDNSAGENHIVRVWNASLTPDGAVGLIQDEFGTFTLTATLQDDSNGDHGGSIADPLYHSQLVPAAA